MVFASVDDYILRYGVPADEAQVAILLEDASALLEAAFEEFFGCKYAEGISDVFDRAVCAVCCSLTNRVLSAPSAMLGATQYSQSAGGYSASITYGSALGDLYLGKADKIRLGLIGTIRRVIYPDEHEVCV